MTASLPQTALSNPLKGTVPENYLPAEDIIASIHITSIYVLVSFSSQFKGLKKTEDFFFFFKHPPSRASRS